MKNKAIFLILVINLIFIPTAKASFNLNPIYPIEGQFIGLKGDYYLDDWQPHTSLAYGFESGDIYYKLGSRYQLNNKISFDAKYSSWLNYNLPSYRVEEGFKIDLNYNKKWGEEFEIGIFTGEIAKKDGKAIATTYISSNYQRELYYSWGKEANLHLDVTSGQVKETSDTYHISHLKLPIKIEQLSIIPQVGYIRGSDKISPTYKLKNYLVGHSNNKEGIFLLNLKFERRSDLFAKSQISVLEMMDLITFVSFGDLLTAEQGVKDLTLNATGGVGLSLKLGQTDFRVKGVLDDRVKTELLFNVAISF